MSLEDTLSAVADPTRRAMLQRLAYGPATVGQLAALFPISRPAVSQHVKVLRDAGLVAPLGSARTSPYELVPGPLFHVENWARNLTDRWTSAPTHRAMRPADHPSKEPR